ncbi:MAG: glycosyltransferase family 2 protein [Algicola sp.]|nr:glycosyltransferase family 2 protein [Algicola sp.]
MLFRFLKYLQPTHYFQLFSKANASVFPVIEDLNADELGLVTLDDQYQSKRAIEYDMSWQAIQNGYLGNAKTYHHFEAVSIQDNYRFIRKNFHKSWVFYVLIIRLLSFKNPFVEVKGWYKTKNVSRTKVEKKSFYDEDFNTHTSTLKQKSPKVSVVIPTLNRYEYLNDILKDLEVQDYKNFEVIVVDQSDNFNKDFYTKFNLDFNIIHQKEKALWLARNTAVKNAKGELIALSEDDVRINPDWISAHLKCLDFFDAEVSAGVFYPKGKQIPVERSYFSIASQFATGNAMLYKHVFKQVGLFDRQFEKQRMGDGEFGLRIYLEGIKSVSNPLASCIDIKANSGGLREMGSWDAFRPSNFFAPRPIPSVLYFFRRYFGKKASRLSLLRTVPLSIFPYQFKKNKPLLLLGTCITVLIFPLVIYQVSKSWHLATKKIKQGPLIETLD